MCATVIDETSLLLLLRLRTRILQACPTKPILTTSTASINGTWFRDFNSFVRLFLHHSTLGSYAQLLIGETGTGIFLHHDHLATASWQAHVVGRKVRHRFCVTYMCVMNETINSCLPPPCILHINSLTPSVLQAWIVW